MISEKLYVGNKYDLLHQCMIIHSHMEHLILYHSMDNIYLLKINLFHKFNKVA